MRSDNLIRRKVLKLYPTPFRCEVVGSCSEQTGTRVVAASLVPER